MFYLSYDELIQERESWDIYYDKLINKLFNKQLELDSKGFDSSWIQIKIQNLEYARESCYDRFTKMINKRG